METITYDVSMGEAPLTRWVIRWVIIGGVNDIGRGVPYRKKPAPTPVDLWWEPVPKQRR